MNHFLKVFIEFITVLLLFYVLVVWPQGMWDLVPQAGIKPVPPALEGAVLTPGSSGKFQHTSLFEEPTFGFFSLMYMVDLQTAWV